MCGERTYVFVAYSKSGPGKKSFCVHPPHTSNSLVPEPPEISTTLLAIIYSACIKKKKSDIQNCKEGRLIPALWFKDHFSDQREDNGHDSFLAMIPFFQAEELPTLVCVLHKCFICLISKCLLRIILRPHSSNKKWSLSKHQATLRPPPLPALPPGALLSHRGLCWGQVYGDALSALEGRGWQGLS